ncbi:unnamed protein product [Moneuplotes crassus]|uniref:Uncharacterized protein n=1 Tax=Euplotes crassus TaxID=5936 RepID=A0AAD1U260_EUPCR|nr:unnamed protein product [Moneuplotes crassus]
MSVIIVIIRQELNSRFIKPTRQLHNLFLWFYFREPIHKSRDKPSVSDTAHNSRSTVEL